MTHYPSELRRSTLSNRWVLIAADRAKRPHEFKEPAVDVNARDPFAPENIPVDDIVDQFPTETADEYQMPADWRVITIKNKFPFLVPGDEPRVHGHIRDGYGFHELVIHSPERDRNIEDFESLQTEYLLQMFIKRYQALAKESHIQHVQIFTNRGPEAGASVVHPHSQIVALPIVPAYIRALIDTAREHAKTSDVGIIDDELETETTNGERVIAETEHFLVYCPFAPHADYHIRILPKRHEHQFAAMTDVEVTDLAVVLRATYRRLNAVAGVPPYNTYIRTAPVHEPNLDGFRWHVDIIPHLSTPGGLELSTGLEVVTVPPELAAEKLRDASGTE